MNLVWVALGVASFICMAGLWLAIKLEDWAEESKMSNEHLAYWCGLLIVMIFAASWIIWWFT